MREGEGGREGGREGEGAQGGDSGPERRVCASAGDVGDGESPQRACAVWGSTIDQALMDFSAVGERDRQAQAGGGQGCGTGAAPRQPARASCMREARVRTARSGHLTPMPSADPQSVRGSGVPSDARAAVAKRELSLGATCSASSRRRDLRRGWGWRRSRRRSGRRKVL